MLIAQWRSGQVLEVIPESMFSLVKIWSKTPVKRTGQMLAAQWRHGQVLEVIPESMFALLNDIITTQARCAQRAGFGPRLTAV
jgi:hypothetical protein